MKVFLVGLPGCGKSTLGQQLASLSNKPFVDLDSVIVEGEGQEVSNIFIRQGEEAFRKIERGYLAEWCNRNEDFVMATGGGTPCFHNNAELINQSGISVFIDTPTSEIAERMMKTELAKRPLFAGQDALTIEGRVKQMRDQRIQFYEMAQIKVSGLDITPNRINQLITSLER